MAAAPAEFLTALKTFASGETSLAEFVVVINRVLRAGPQVVLYEEAQPDVAFGAELDAAMYLDMVADDGPEHDESEARRLAGSLAALLQGFRQSDPFLADLLTLARWKPRSVDRLRAYAAGDLDRAGFERFVSRRPWSPSLQHAVLQLSEIEAASLARYLEADEWASTADLLRQHAGSDF